MEALDYARTALCTSLSLAPHSGMPFVWLPLAHRVCLVTLVSRGSNRDSNVCWMEEKSSFFWGFLLLRLLFLFPLSGWGLSTRKEHTSLREDWIGSVGMYSPKVSRGSTWAEGGAQRALCCLVPSKTGPGETAGEDHSDFGHSQI